MKKKLEIYYERVAKFVLYLATLSLVCARREREFYTNIREVFILFN